MVDTYKYYSRYVDKEDIAKSNEELVESYKAATAESRQSQLFSALFVKNFAMMLKVANNWDYVDSAEKASMVTLELLNAIADYDGSVKFLTYFTTRLENMFLWEYSKKKDIIRIISEAASLDETVDEDPEGEFKYQIEDKFAEQERRTREFYFDIDKMFENEFKYCVDKAYYDKLVKAKEMIEILKQDHTLVNDQVARMLGLFVDKATKEQKARDEHAYIFDFSPKYPDYKRVKIVDNAGNLLRYEVREEPKVKRAQWSKIADLRKFLAILFAEYGICSAISDN